MAVVALEIQGREPVLGGAPFGAGGAYERIAGVIRFAIDPSWPVHAAIADLQHAPHDGQGRVESSADVDCLCPVAGGCRNLLLAVPNRGRRMALTHGATPTDDPTTEADFGTGFLLLQGYTVAGSTGSPSPTCRARAA